MSLCLFLCLSGVPCAPARPIVSNILGTGICSQRGGPIVFFPLSFRRASSGMCFYNLRRRRSLSLVLGGVVCHSDQCWPLLLGKSHPWSTFSPWCGWVSPKTRHFLPTLLSVAGGGAPLTLFSYCGYSVAILHILCMAQHPRPPLRFGDQFGADPH